MFPCLLYRRPMWGRLVMSGLPGDAPVNDERQVSLESIPGSGFPVTEKRRSNKVLDTLKKEYRRTSTAHRGQHKAQRGVGVFVVVGAAYHLSSGLVLTLVEDQRYSLIAP